MTDFSMYINDVAKKPSITGAWRQGPVISFDDLKYARGNVERISHAEAMAPGGGPAPKAEYRGWSPVEKKPAAKSAGGQSDPLMGFGKHKSMTMKWVKQNEPGYWEWCIENIGWFAAKVEKAGL